MKKRTAVKFRIPLELRGRITKSARKNKNSINAELCERLTNSFRAEDQETLAERAVKRSAYAFRQAVDISKIEIQLAELLVGIASLQKCLSDIWQTSEIKQKSTDIQAPSLAMENAKLRAALWRFVKPFANQAEENAAYNEAITILEAVEP